MMTQTGREAARGRRRMGNSRAQCFGFYKKTGLRDDLVAAVHP